MKVISFANQKGGVGKSTVCYNTGVALAMSGARVLVIDSDPQGDSSCMADYEEGGITLRDVLNGTPIKEAIRPADGCHIITADDELSLSEVELLDEPRTALRDALKPIKRQYDYILIDCPPSLNVLTVNALTASDGVIIPVQAQYLPLKGVKRLYGTIQTVTEKLNKKLKVAGVVLTFYNERRGLDREVMESLTEVFGPKVFNTRISISTKLAEAPSYGKSIFRYSPRSKAAKQFEALADEIRNI